MLGFCYLYLIGSQNKTKSTQSLYAICRCVNMFEKSCELLTSSLIIPVDKAPSSSQLDPFTFRIFENRVRTIEISGVVCSARALRTHPRESRGNTRPYSTAHNNILNTTAGHAIRQMHADAIPPPIWWWGDIDAYIMLMTISATATGMPMATSLAFVSASLLSVLTTLIKYNLKVLPGMKVKLIIYIFF